MSERWLGHMVESARVPRWVAEHVERSRSPVSSRLGDLRDPAQLVFESCPYLGAAAKVTCARANALRSSNPMNKSMSAQRCVSRIHVQSRFSSCERGRDIGASDALAGFWNATMPASRT
jgi:hypothetical protein